MSGHTIELLLLFIQQLPIALSRLLWNFWVAVVKARLNCLYLMLFVSSLFFFTREAYHSLGRFFFLEGSVNQPAKSSTEE